jgi:hypothetical protein
MNRLLHGSVLSAALGLGFVSAVAQATPTLPDPNTLVCQNGQCVPVAVKYDDVYSYSTRVLNYLYPNDGWLASAGTGTIDVLITTRASGQTNSGGTLAQYNIPDPTTNPNTNPILDNWGGGGPTPSSTGPMLVSDLVNYLSTNFGGAIPVFTFDQNETGGNPDLLASAKAEILDTNGNVVHTWSFDNLTQPGDGTYDPNNPVTASGQICIPDIHTADQTDQVCFDNNVGSGKFDYILFAPTMNLANAAYNQPGYTFKLTWNFQNVDDGGEEIALTGRFAPGSTCETDPTLPQCQTIPEPNSLALFGIAVLALAGISRKSFKFRR